VLTSSERICVFIVDDSAMNKNRSKEVELLARVYDHVSDRFIKGFTLLTLGWSDGFSFAPLDFAILSSAKEKNRYNGIKEGLDKRLCGYKRRQEALGTKPKTVEQMLDRALRAGFTADYLLMDSWFTHMPLVKEILSKQMHVIGRLKDIKQRFIYQGQPLSLSELYALVPKTKTCKAAQIFGSIRVNSASGENLKIVFVRNRNKKKEWMAILTTDAAEAVRIYGMRWSIEPFHKVIKSHLKLGKEFEGRSF
jgi:hypothetical protein